MSMIRANVEQNCIKEFNFSSMVEMDDAPRGKKKTLDDGYQTPPEMIFPAKESNSRKML
jgi:hypothetical protein